LTMYIKGKQANEVRDKKGFMFVRPFALYKDAFGERHLTLACFMLRAEDVDYTKAGGVGITGAQCAEYNCADNDCLRYKRGPFSSPELTNILKYLDE